MKVRRVSKHGIAAFSLISHDNRLDYVSITACLCVDKITREVVDGIRFSFLFHSKWRRQISGTVDVSDDY